MAQESVGVDFVITKYLSSLHLKDGFITGEVRGISIPLPKDCTRLQRRIIKQIHLKAGVLIAWNIWTLWIIWSGCPWGHWLKH